MWGNFESLFKTKNGIDFDIIKDFTGCVRPGEVFTGLIELTVDAAGTRSPWQWMHDFPTNDGQSTRTLYEH